MRTHGIMETLAKIRHFSGWNGHFRQIISLLQIAKWYSYMALLSSIGLVLHNQTWHTRHVIIVPMKHYYSMYSATMQFLYSPP